MYAFYFNRIHWGVKSDTYFWFNGTTFRFWSPFGSFLDFGLVPLGPIVLKGAWPQHLLLLHHPLFVLRAIHGAPSEIPLLRMQAACPWRTTANTNPPPCWTLALSVFPQRGQHDHQAELTFASLAGTSLPCPVPGPGALGAAPPGPEPRSGPAAAGAAARALQEPTAPQRRGPARFSPLPSPPSGRTRHRAPPTPQPSAPPRSSSPDTAQAPASGARPARSSARRPRYLEGRGTPGVPPLFPRRGPAPAAALPGPGGAAPPGKRRGAAAAEAPPGPEAPSRGAAPPRAPPRAAAEGPGQTLTHLR